MTAYLFWRLIKFLTLALFAAGALITFSSGQRTTRFAGQNLACIGVVGTWVSGYAMLKLTGRSISAEWILAAMLFSSMAFHGVALLAHRTKNDGRSLSAACLIIAGLVGAIAAMVLRVFDVWAWLFAAGLGFAFTIPVARQLPGCERGELDTLSWRWFVAIARLEGLSLILMMLVSMPLKKLAGISIDQNTGLLGLAHGVLYLVYLQALMSTSRTLGWGWKRTLVGFVLALIPFGTFYFERSVNRADSAKPALD